MPKKLSARIKYFKKIPRTIILSKEDILSVSELSNNCLFQNKQKEAIFIFLFAIFFLGFVNTSLAQGVYFISDSINTSEDGYIRLSWDSEAEGGVFELQESTTEDFESHKVVYKGPDLATFISGLENGKYFYRVRRNDGQWSSPIVLIVRHHSLQLAFSLFGLGALVFILTAWVIIKGTRQQRDTTN